RSTLANLFFFITKTVRLSPLRVRTVFSFIETSFVSLWECSKDFPSYFTFILGGSLIESVTWSSKTRICLLSPPQMYLNMTLLTSLIISLYNTHSQQFSFFFLIQSK